MENSAKFMKNSGLTASSSESLPVSVAALRKPYTSPAHVGEPAGPGDESPKGYDGIATRYDHKGS